MMKERFLLAKERIVTIKEETMLEPFDLYFKQVALFLVKLADAYELVEREGLMQMDADALKQMHDTLFEDLLSENYKASYANPAYAQEMLSEDFSQYLSLVCGEMFAAIPGVYEGDLFELVIRMELFLELYACFLCSFEELGTAPKVQEVKDIIYYYAADYMEDALAKRVKAKCDPDMDFAYQIIMGSDLSAPDYLYRFGEYISDNETKTAAYMAAASDAQIKLMADTYTEGYRIGFEKTGKDLSKKKVVQIIYPLGFERMIKVAIANFEQMGLRPTIMRTPHSIFDRRGLAVGGFYSTNINKQFAYDHKDDEALYLDKQFMQRKLDDSKNAYELVKELAKVHAGPALVEVFGEAPFLPEEKEQAPKMDEVQQELATKYQAKNGQIINEYIPGEERSFTIIAFPLPCIGEKYAEIMDETIKLNTLDYETYEKIQQTIIDTLDACEYVVVRGKGENRTDMRISLVSLADPKKQTKFENCVADVNIPVGEVFTSPVLKGTSGVLHVTEVFLNEIQYKNLWIAFEDGMVLDYGCDNFASEEECTKFIKDNILYHHESLPIGEFAIGTNTTAYKMGQTYGIAHLLPILIAEKTGPHFALGDTCYSHAEDVAVYNADGKEIIARDNEISILRKSDVSKAYFQCHTDITIPYDELGEIYGVTKENGKRSIIEDGRFVLEGCEKLNEALDA